ncbi:FAD-dependent oxidoreductase [Paenibacillus sp. DMB20]|uniref:FAD-dependent oxidoreductase n=1 Tax=Paenibacillus sp. DMB20 TaxID=1642570 RepID=UPI001364BF70|nr:FAD-dependent oxidoreductase [Paenibacillus sp. DMB20]
MGGGVVGRAITFKLSEGNHNLRILCIDPRRKANGSASYAAGAMLGAYGEISAHKTKELDINETDFRIQAQKIYPEWLERIKERSGRDIYAKMGTFLIANVAGAQDRSHLMKIAEELTARHESFQWTDPADIPSFRPNPDYLAYQGLYIPKEGCVDASDLMESLAKAAIKSGVEHLGKAVRKLMVEGNKVVGVVAEDEKLYADHVVLCAGVGIGKIMDDTHIPAGIPYLMPGKGVGLAVSTGVSFPNVIRTPDRGFACGAHIVPRSDSTVYIGTTNQVSSLSGLQNGVTSGEVHTLLHSAIHEIHTGLRTATIEKMYFGSRPVTADGYPVIGDTEVEGLYVATGTYRNGILMAPLIAEIVGAKITESPIKFDNPFSAERRKMLLDRVADGKEALIENGIRDLVSFIQEPTGSLPYHRSQELTNFITTLASMVLTGDQPKYTQLLEKSKELLETCPIAEIVPQLFYKYHEFKAGERDGQT